MLEYLEKVIKKTIGEQYTSVDMNYHRWDWHEGVMLYSIIVASDTLSCDKFQNNPKAKILHSDCMAFVNEYISLHLNKGLPPKKINTTIGINAVLKLYDMTGNKQYKAICDEWAEYCIAEAERGDEGTICHTVLDKNLDRQIWADTLFMGVVYMVRYGQFFNQPLYIKEAARQMLLHYKYLFDSNTKLLYHGYECNDRSHFSAVKWGRANGWALLSAVEFLAALPGYYPEKEKIRACFNSHVKAMISRQESSGMWHTVLDNPATYEETTVACCFYSAIYKASKMGFLDIDCSEALRLAILAIKRNVTQDGVITNTSGGTPIMPNEEKYNEIVKNVSYYGQGLGILALCAELA